MPQINLLPWREELRGRRQKEFLTLVVVTLLVMGGVVGGMHLHMLGRIDYQVDRNTYVQAEIEKLQKQIEEIKSLKRQKERLLARTAKIQQLQSGRPDIVHLMDELVTTLPDGVYFTRLVQKGGVLALNGIAQSNARVSSLMRKLEASTWLETPGLKEIRRDKPAAGQEVRNSIFALSIKQTKQKSKKDEEEG